MSTGETALYESAQPPDGPSPDAQSPDAEWPDAEPKRRRPFPFGLVALVSVLVLIALEVTGVLLAVSGAYAAATFIGQAIIVLTFVPFVLGIVGVILNRGRLTGAIAIVLAVLTNPLVLNTVLGFFGGR
ncbi:MULTISPECIES: hypothetical protein [unclassified Cryobacterium]|uniref:hypothetical protein n=1 Tax=unclassified Cryobacterium TaxID=2649013 RepID=UPI001444DA2F|nr:MULTISPECIES: hypothetical protein [unclassified Cryobacterium]